MTDARAAVLCKTSEYFAELPSDRLNQGSGTFCLIEPCCVGAHLAFLLDALGDYTIRPDFLMGADAWAAAIGGNRAHAILLLRNAGAGHNPFSADDWPKPPAEVFRDLVNVETLPPLMGRDFDRCNFTGAYMRGADMRACTFRGAMLRETDFEGADLRAAIFTGALQANMILHGARIDGAKGLWQE